MRPKLYPDFLITKICINWEITLLALIPTTALPGHRGSGCFFSVAFVHVKIYVAIENISYITFQWALKISGKLFREIVDGRIT